MEKKILLGNGNGYSPKFSIWAAVFLGILFLIIGAFVLSGHYYLPFKLSFGIIELIAGVYAMVYAFMVFGSKSRYAPHVIIGDSFIEFKRNLFKPSKRLIWESIERINFSSYEITFVLGDSDETFDYVANPDISIKVKRAIRDVANDKGIEVFGG